MNDPPLSSLCESLLRLGVYEIGSDIVLVDTDRCGVVQGCDDGSGRMPLADEAS